MGKILTAADFGTVFFFTAAYQKSRLIHRYRHDQFIATELLPLEVSRICYSSK
jgi:hypothetical protein